LEARFLPELPLSWWYCYLQTCCLQKPSVCLWEGIVSWWYPKCIGKANEASGVCIFLIIRFLTFIPISKWKLYEVQ
jgi:hypothetical protein